MFCPNCKTEFGGETAFCPKCGAALNSSGADSEPTAEWGLAPKLRSIKNWPTDENGEPEKAELVAHSTCLNMEEKMMRNMLEAYGIPCLIAYPHDGGFGKVLLGMSASGADVYVPQSSAKDAKALIGGNDDD